jgi:Activator of Hsp90 ATPase homolog 1-like protein
MTSTDNTRETVIPLRRPPVRESTLVQSDVAHTFEVFVRTIGAWWPIQPMSFGRERVRDVTFEPRAGGRVYETWDDGTTVDWGQVSVWEPPSRFVMSWLSTPEPTEVELTFNVLGPMLTRVSVEHRGWDALTEEQLAEDCAAPGGYRSGAYSRGWAHVLALLTAAAESDARTANQEEPPS